MSKIEKDARLRREQDILDRLDNAKRLIQMETTLMTADRCGRYRSYKPYTLKENQAFGNNLLDSLREQIQMDLLSIVALCYGDNPDIGEPVPMLKWRQPVSGEHPEDKFRAMWDECLEWNA